MSHFSKMRIQGLRRLKDVELPLGPLNVLVGPNGSGKTTLLDAFRLLAASAGGELGNFISAGRGINEQITADAGVRELRMELHLERSDSREPFDYSLGLEPVGIDYRVADERLAECRDMPPGPLLHITSQRGTVRYYDAGQKTLVPPAWQHNPAETALHQASRSFSQAQYFKKTLASVALFHHLDIGPKAPVRLPQTMQPAPLPGVNGEFLLSCLYALREQHPDRYDTVEDTLRAAFPGFLRLGFPAIAAGTMAMTWQDEHLGSPIYTHQLSEGTLRFIWLTTLLQCEVLPAITLIDEPEISLHPRLLGLLADLLHDAAQRTQLIVATHSEQLIRHLTPAEVIVCGIGADGFAAVKSASSLNLEGWMQDFSLNELWRMGKFEERE